MSLRTDRSRLSPSQRQARAYGFPCNRYVTCMLIIACGATGCFGDWSETVRPTVSTPDVASLTITSLDGQSLAISQVAEPGIVGLVRGTVLQQFHQRRGTEERTGKLIQMNHN